MKEKLKNLKLSDAVVKETIEKSTEVDKECIKERGKRFDEIVKFVENQDNNMKEVIKNSDLSGKEKVEVYAEGQKKAREFVANESDKSDENNHKEAQENKKFNLVTPLLFGGCVGGSIVVTKIFYDYRRQICDFVAQIPRLVKK